jgi:hypothetical protein
VTSFNLLSQAAVVSATPARKSGIFRGLQTCPRG